MTTVAWFVLAALLEISGCFAFWSWLRQGRPAWLVVPGIVSLALFAASLTRVESALAGRAFAAYGGIYIAAALLWLWIVERMRPDRWDLMGAVVCIAGALIITFGRR